MLKLRPTILLLVIVFLLSCNKSTHYITVKHVKPVNRNRFYKPGKDKRKKRTKYVKVKILKRSGEVKPPKEKKKKPPKQKKIKSDSLSNQAVPDEEINAPQTNESDSTGFLP